MVPALILYTCQHLHLVEAVAVLDSGAAIVGCDDCMLRVWQAMDADSGASTAGASNDLHSGPPVAAILTEDHHTGRLERLGVCTGTSIFRLSS